MRNNPNLRAEKYRMDGPPNSSAGAFRINWRGAMLRVIASNGGGWDHVSVSLAGRTPTWEEMDFVKDIFFSEDETVMQLHVPRREHINCHPNCLHLWRPQTLCEMNAIKEEWEKSGETYPYALESPGEIPRPFGWMVGPALQTA